CSRTRPNDSGAAPSLPGTRSGPGRGSPRSGKTMRGGNNAIIASLFGEEPQVSDPKDAPFLVAAAQAAPVFLDRAATVDTACSLSAEAGARGAKLIAFPEGFIPAYPFWVWFIPAGNTHALRELYAELLDQAVTIPGEATDRLCAAAREAGVNV